MKCEKRFPRLSRVLLMIGVYALIGLPLEARVVPCPDQQIDSSAAIQAALMAARTGETVSLQACTYYVANPIWVQKAFHGALRGAGKDQTVITTLPGSKINGIPNPWGFGSLSTIFQFEVPPGQKGNIQVSDFSIVITDPEPAGTQDSNDFFQHALYNLFVVSGTKVDTRFEHLRLVASAGNVQNRNVAHAFHIAGFPTDLMKGNHLLSDTDLEMMAIAYDTFWMQDSSLKVTNSTFTNNSWGPILEDCSNCVGEVTSNTVTSPDFEGIAISQGGLSDFIPAKPSSYLVTHNTILASGTTVFPSGFADGVLLIDLAPFPSLYAGVAFNTITLEDTQGAGIVGIGAQKASALSNNITGSGLAGITTGIAGDTVTGWLILRNNVEGVTALVAPVWLGPGTNHCTVVGDGHTTLVLDEGTDNKLINVTKTQASAATSKPTKRMPLRRPPLPRPR
jgi:hypothetical protein